MKTYVNSTNPIHLAAAYKTLDRDARFVYNVIVHNYKKDSPQYKLAQATADVHGWGSLGN